MNAQLSQATNVMPLEFSAPVYLSHSSSTLYEVCPNKYRQRYKERLESAATGVSLGYGGAYDEATCAFIVAHALGHEGQLDPVRIFEEKFEEFVRSHTVSYSTTFDSQQTCVASGKVLVEKFVESWLAHGYTAALDPDGVPIVQRELRVKLAHNVFYTSIIDVLIMTRDCEMLLSDIKTAAQASDGSFHLNAGQLTGQQLVVEAHRDALGIDKVDGLCFYQGLKRTIPKPAKGGKAGKGMGPVVLDPMVCPPRTEAELQAYVQSRLWIAEDIRRGRFPKRPLDAYNSPCSDLCDYKQNCIHGDRTGLRVREARKMSASLPSQTAPF